MFYTYILQSIKDPTQEYVGHTTDLRNRFTEHESGKCTSTSKFRPWKIKCYFAFETIEKVQEFEKYLKSGSGHSFRKRHF